MLFSITKRRCNDRRQSKINDNYKEQIEYNTKRGGSESRRHPKKDEKCSRNSKWYLDQTTKIQRQKKTIEDRRQLRRTK